MRSVVIAGLVVLSGCVTPQGLPQKLQALGTEPFWAIYVEPGKLRYTSPDTLDGTTFPATETEQGSGKRFAGTLEGMQVVLTVTPGTCSDGMSDTVYPYAATLTFGSEVRKGCARPQ